MLKQVFQNARIVGLVGEKHTGKTNNLVAMIIDYRKKNKEVPIYVYGMPQSVMEYLDRFNVKEISSLKQLVYKKDCIIILDEMQKLNLNDRRYKDQLNEFVDFVYHNNVYVILSSPNIREFNSVIGGVIEKWLLKNVRIDMCVNGSQLKGVVEEYKGSRKQLGAVKVEPDEILLVNQDEERVIHCPYIKEVDTKQKNKELF